MTDAKDTMGSPRYFGIRPAPGTCCPEKKIVDGRCTGCGTEEDS